VDGRRCGAFDRNYKKKNSYLFIFTFGSRSITNSALFICLLYEYSKRFVQPVVRSVVQPAAKSKRPLAGALRGRRLGLATSSELERRSVDSGTHLTSGSLSCCYFSRIQFRLRFV